MPARPCDHPTSWLCSARRPKLRRWWTKYFASLAYPRRFEARLPLARAPIYAALRSLLQLAADDWTFRGLLCVLGHNYVQPSWDEWQPANRTSAERMVRRLQIPRGREAILCAVDRSARVELSDDAPAARLRHRETARAACGVLSRLSDALASLRAKRPPANG